MQRQHSNEDFNEKKSRYLVTDYDMCAIAYNGTDPEMLSKPLLHFATQKLYDGFYGCSHRAYKSRSFIVKNAMQQIPEGGYSQEDVTKYATIVAVTENLKKRLNLPCMAVSTFEDTMSDRVCGQGYEQILKPAELDGVKPSSRICASFWRFVIFNIHDKNLQLLQIALHAILVSKHKVISLHYIDDNPKIIANAFSAKDQKDWPANVKLKFFLHGATGDNATITKVRNQDQLDAAVRQRDESNTGMKVTKQ